MNILREGNTKLPYPIPIPLMTLPRNIILSISIVKHQLGHTITSSLTTAVWRKFVWHLPAPTVMLL